MAKSFSIDLRLRVLKAISDGMSRRQAASAPRAGARLGDARPKPQGGDRRSHRVEAHQALIFKMVDEVPDITLADVRSRLAESGVSVSILRTSPNHIERKSAHATEQDRPDILKRRQAWFDGQLDLDPGQLVFIDETGATTKVARLHGRPLRATDSGWACPTDLTTTFIGGLRLSGMTAPRSSMDR
jgi:hypothetical protein